MGYLRLADYTANIQSVVFNQLIQTNDALRLVKEQVAQALITSYIVQKFNVAEEFTLTTKFLKTTIYNGNALIELDFPAYDTAVNYTGVGTDIVTNNKVCYVLKISGATGAFDPTKWNAFGNQFDLFYVKLPYPEFQQTNFYSKGDPVFWKNKIYQNLIPTAIPDHITQLQAGQYANIPLNNIFPDDKINGPSNWGTGIDFSLTSLIPNTTKPAWAAGNYASGSFVTKGGIIYQNVVNAVAADVPGVAFKVWQPVTWVLGDNRNPQLVECMVWITIEKLAPLISPRTQPVFWDKKYQEMITWLNMCADGIVTLDAPLLQASQGGKIRFGGNIKQNNSF